MTMPADKKLLTVCFLHQPPRLLLGMKKRGFGKGRWNGFGGKVKAGESVEDAARREVFEESGVTVGKLTPFGIVEFVFKNEPEKLLEVRVFRSSDFAGEPIETQEMKPRWFDERAVPYEAMWSSDRHWLPFLLSGKRFKARFLYESSDSNVILEQTVAELS